MGDLMTWLQTAAPDIYEARAWLLVAAVAFVPQLPWFSARGTPGDWR